MNAHFGLAALLVLSACSTRPPSESPLSSGASPSDSWPPGEVHQGHGVVRTIKGSATYSIGTNGWSSLSMGAELAPGTVVISGRESQVDIYLGMNGPTLRVTPQTTVVLERLNMAGSGAGLLTDTKLDLRSGRILGSVRPLTPSSQYQIATPTGYALTRGGEFDVSAKKDSRGKFESTYVAVPEELWGVEMIDGVKKQWRVKAGQAFTSQQALEAVPMN